VAIVKKLAFLQWMAALAFLAGCAEGVVFQFDSSVPADQRELMELDLSRLNSIELPQASTDDLATVGVGALSPIALNDWLSKRTKYIVGESFSWKVNSRIISRSAPKTPVIVAGNVLKDPFSAASAKTVMWNLGSFLYLDGKEQSQTYAIDLEAERMEVFTPRVGIVQIGEGLFSVNAVKNTPLDAYANSLLRIATYFHESRHTDGNGEHAAYPHTACPSGHQYAELYACENNLNGPYAIQAVLLRYFYSGCQECSETELAGLMLSLADYQSRVLPGAQFRDSRPEALK